MAKKPTRRQRKLISEHGLRPENWLVIKIQWDICTSDTERPVL